MSLGHATQITNYGIIWEDMMSPFGFTSFAFDPTTNKSNNQELALMLKQQSANSTLDDNDYKIMLNDKTFFPSTLEQYQAQTNSLLVIAMDWWKGASFSANLIQYHINHIKSNQQMYKLRQDDDALFLTKVGYVVNLNFQRYLRTITDNDDFTLVGKQDIIDDLTALHGRVMGSTEICVLPSTMVTKTTQQKRGGHQRNDNGTADMGSPTKKGKVDAFQCNFTKTDWKLPSTRSSEYSSIFTRQCLDRMPKAPNKEGKLRPFCNKALSLGVCRLGSACKFIHDKPSKHGKEADVNAFYQAAYN